MDSTLDTAPASIDAMQMRLDEKSPSSGKTAGIVLVVLLIVLAVSVLTTFGAMRLNKTLREQRGERLVSKAVERQLLGQGNLAAGMHPSADGGEKRFLTMADGALPGGAYAVSATQMHEDAIRRRQPSASGGSPFADGASAGDRVSGGLGFASTPGGRKTMDMTAVAGGATPGGRGNAFASGTGGDVASSTSGAGAIEDITKAALETLLEQGKTVVVMFYAPWCGHCKHAKPEFHKAAASFEGAVFALVDGDKNPALTAEAKVQGFPTILKYRKGAAPAPFNGGQRTKDEFVRFASSA